jgi:hypothetical protein
VSDRRHDQHDQQRGEQPVDHERHERQPEHVEPDVLVELGVLDAEVAAVLEQDPRVPLGRRPRPGDQGQQRRHPEPHLGGPAGHQVVVALQQLVLGPGRAERRRHDLGDVEVGPRQQEEGQDEDEGQAELGGQDPPLDAPQAQRVEPEVVGVDPGDATQRRQEDEQDDQADDEQHPAAARAPQPATEAGSASTG